MECPVIDCAQAEEALQALAEMEAYLEAMGYSLGLAGDDAMRHFESIVETNVGTGESAAALQTNLGYQKFFHDMGSMLLDIPSLTSFTKDRKSVVEGKRVAERVTLGGRRINNTKK